MKLWQDLDEELQKMCAVAVAQWVDLKSPKTPERLQSIIDEDLDLMVNARMRQAIKVAADDAIQGSLNQLIERHMMAWVDKAVSAYRVDPVVFAAMDRALRGLGRKSALNQAERRSAACVRLTRSGFTKGDIAKKLGVRLETVDWLVTQGEARLQMLLAEVAQFEPEKDAAP